MNRAPIFITIIRQISFLALLGFLFVLIAWPFFAALGILFGFAVIGLLVWLPMNIMGVGKPIEWHKVRQTGNRYWGAVAGRCHQMGGELWNHGQPFLARVFETGRYLGRICRETLCGGAVGAMLGMIPTLQHANAKGVVLGVCLGAICGALVGISTRVPVRETI